MGIKFLFLHITGKKILFNQNYFTLLVERITEVY